MWEDGLEAITKKRNKEWKKERKKKVAINALDRENLETETIHEYQRWLGLNQKRANIGPKEWKVWNFVANLW